MVGPIVVGEPVVDPIVVGGPVVGPIVVGAAVVVPTEAPVVGVTPGTPTRGVPGIPWRLRFSVACPF